MKAKTDGPTKATSPTMRSEKDLAEVRAVLAKLRAKLMAEPQDRPDVMNAAIVDVEMTLDYLADRIDAELPGAQS